MGRDMRGIRGRKGMDVVGLVFMHDFSNSRRYLSQNVGWCVCVCVCTYLQVSAEVRRGH
jgi:hypothetical protein